MKKVISVLSAFVLLCSNLSAQDTMSVHLKSGGTYKQAITNVDSITFSKPAPGILAEWDFPIENGKVNLNQTSGSLQLGAFTGFNAVLSADTGKAGVVATGNFWDVNDPGIGIILQYAGLKDMSAVTKITFTAYVENPPKTSPGIMAYVQNGGNLNYAGDYGFWRSAPVSGYKTFEYVINKTAAGLDIKTIASFRIKANGNGESGTGCGTLGGKCAVVHITKVVME
ncbi:MAG: hypothetical protein NT150_11660 [Bacteroidetes bacterium]|nr:hypothetical protein [Bacteroidota bacterium]